MNDETIQRIASRIADKVWTLVDSGGVANRKNIADIAVQAIRARAPIDDDDGFELCATPWAMQRLKLLAMDADDPQDRIEACRAIVACECMIAGVERSCTR